MPSVPSTVDVLIIGSGLAGLRVALSVAESARVRLVTKARDHHSNTNRAQGGIAAVLGPDDRFELHVSDTLRAGAGLCHEDRVRAMVESAPRLIEGLLAVGMDFDRGDDGNYEMGREGGHSRRRVVHSGDFTGRAVEHAMLAAVRAHPSIQVLEDHFAIDLLKDEDGRVSGALVLDERRGEASVHRARFTVIATGGSGKVYRYTSNPDIATGDGVAMSWRAGATVGNLEFEQFHPTCLYHRDAKSFLISEAVRGEGAVLRTLDGEAFMPRYHELADLAPRDVVARAIDTEMKARGDDHVLLDATVIPTELAARRFPNIRARCLEYGIDLTRDMLPVVPAAHYACGGVVADVTGASDLEGLFVVGEAALTGIHGANRLASNSLLEALYFGEAAAKEIARRLGQGSYPVKSVVVPDLGSGAREPTPLQHDWGTARKTMWNYVGIQRTVDRLKVAQRRMDDMAEEAERAVRNQRPSIDLLELRNVTLLGSLVVRCASFRHESRGLHALAEYPKPDDAAFLGDTCIRGPGKAYLRPLKARQVHATRDSI
jgi:L-aspartate oxidase